MARNAAGRKRARAHDGSKYLFGAIPIRAFADPKLSGTDLRILGVVSYIDRFSKNGMGCYANHETIGQMSSVSVTNVSKCLKQLRELGYLRRERQKDRRRWQYHVIHQTADGVLQAPAENAGHDESPSEGASKGLGDPESDGDSWSNDQVSTPDSWPNDQVPAPDSWSNDQTKISGEAPQDTTGEPASGHPVGFPAGGKISRNSGAAKDSAAHIDLDSLVARAFELEPEDIGALDDTETWGVLRGIAARIERRAKEAEAGEEEARLVRVIEEYMEGHVGDMEAVGHVQRIAEDVEMIVYGEPEF